MDQQPESSMPDVAPCPRCGTPARLGAEAGTVSCVACGVVSLASVPGADEPWETDEEPIPEAVNEPLPEGAVRCQWCGAINSSELERCQKCNAVFPKPEMDLAMLKAAEDRLRVLEDEITLRERQRKSGLFGKLFG